MIIINGTLLDNMFSAQCYDFILNKSLRLEKCELFNSAVKNKKRITSRTYYKLYNQLFELNHVRVNPNLDNTLILNKLRDIIKESGVDIKNIPKKDEITICYNPLGELDDNVRFYLNDELNLKFLSSAVKLRIIE